MNRTQLSVAVLLWLGCLLTPGSPARANTSEAADQTKWSQGMVRWHHQWQPHDAMCRDAEYQKLLANYDAERNEAPATEAGQLKMANWCKQHELAEQEEAHLWQVLQLNPNQEDARRRLGFVQVDGQWLSREEIRRGAERNKAAGVALERYGKQLQNMAEDFASPEPKKQQAANKRLQAIRDPAAIPAMELVLGGKPSEAGGQALAEHLAEMTAPEAAVSLARIAAYWPQRSVRTAAALKLKQRSPEQFVPAMLASLSTPTQSQIELLAAPDGRITYRHWFFSEGQEANNLTVLDKTYRRRNGGLVSNGNVLAQEQMAIAVAAEQQKMATEDNNERICKVLKTVFGVELPPKPDLWWTWWNQTNEVFTPGAKPLQQKYAYQVSYVADQPRFYGGRLVSSGGEGGSPQRSPQRYECLVAGTPIQTIAGPVAVEKVQAGDLVLSQNVETGELAYKPVLTTTVRPPEKLLRWELSGESVTCSGGHVFWEADGGWLRARQFKAGTRLHALTGVQDVVSVTEVPAETTYNLIVADFHSYFVGNSKLLSHDNTVTLPTNRTNPGVAPAETESARQAPAKKPRSTAAEK